MRPMVSLMVLGFLACSPEPAAAPKSSAPGDDATRSADAGPDVEGTCRNLLAPYLPELDEEEAEEEMRQCLERMRRLHSTEPKDYEWQAECLANAKTREAVETCRTPRPLSPDEERERQTWVALAKTAHHLAYYVALHERCPSALEDLVGESMAPKLPTDAWGRPFVLRCELKPATRIVISLGPDGVLGTEDDYHRDDDDDGRGPPK